MIARSTQVLLTGSGLSLSRFFFESRQTSGLYPKAMANATKKIVYMQFLTAVAVQGARVRSHI